MWTLRTASSMGLPYSALLAFVPELTHEGIPGWTDQIWPDFFSSFSSYLFSINFKIFGEKYPILFHI
jgi:hypothetical protein